MKNESEPQYVEKCCELHYFLERVASRKLYMPELAELALSNQCIGHLEDGAETLSVFVLLTTLLRDCAWCEKPCVEFETLELINRRSYHCDASDLRDYVELYENEGLIIVDGNYIVITDKGESVIQILIGSLLKNIKTRLLLALKKEIDAEKRKMITKAKLQ